MARVPKSMNDRENRVAASDFLLCTTTTPQLRVGAWLHGVASCSVFGNRPDVHFDFVFRLPVTFPRFACRHFDATQHLRTIHDLGSPIGYPIRADDHRFELF